MKLRRRYMKLKEDMPLLSGEDRGRYFGKRGSVSRLMSFISLYLHLPPFISFYLNLPLSTSFALAKLKFKYI